MTAAMKNLIRRFQLWSFCLIFPILTSCKDQEAQIASLKENISSLRDANEAGDKELQKITQKISALKQQVKSEASKRNDLEAKYQKSSATQRLIAKYRAELEESLKKFEESVGSYQKQYLP